MSSKAQKLATLSSDVNELADLADQVTEIENAISRANTNAQEIDSISDSLEELSAINSIYNSGISYSTDGVNEYFDANTPANTLSSTEFIEMNLTNPQEGDLMSFDAAANNWINSAAPEEPIPVLSFRNKIINGNFDIWQRGTSQTTSDYGSVDRWRPTHFGSTKTASQQAFTLGQTDVPGNPKYYLRHVVSSVAGSGNFCLIIHKIEGVTTLAGQTATLSFWAKADSNKNIATEFLQYFGTGGSPSALVNTIGVTTHNLTTSWQKFTATVAVPSISGKTLGSNGDDRLELNFWFETGSDFSSRTNSLGNQSGTFDIAQVQVEEGPVATEFEHRPYGLELDLCRRFYQKYWYAQATSMTPGLAGTYWGVDIQFNTTFRTSPTLSIVTPSASMANHIEIWGGYVLKVQSTSHNQNSFYFCICDSATYSYKAMFHFECDAEL